MIFILTLSFVSFVNIAIVLIIKLCILYQDLENYIRNHPDSRFEKLQEIGKQLIDNDIMTLSIQTDVESLINRWESLNKQVIVRSCFFSCLY